MEAAARAAARATTAAATENKGGILGGVLRRCSFRRNSCKADDIPPEMRARRGSEDLGHAKPKRRAAYAVARMPNRRWLVRPRLGARRLMRAGAPVRWPSVPSICWCGLSRETAAAPGHDIFTLSNKVDEMLAMLESTTRQMDELRSTITPQFVQFRAAQG